MQRSNLHIASKNVFGLTGADTIFGACIAAS
jgi:hypothetical protein